MPAWSPSALSASISAGAAGASAHDLLIVYAGAVGDRAILGSPPAWIISRPSAVSCQSTRSM
jgi:hypothetical protein